MNDIIDDLINDFERIDKALDKVCNASEEAINEHFNSWSQRGVQMVHFNDIFGKLPSNRTTWQIDIDKEIKRYG
ncbi:MAG: hypothetical protein GY754_47285 [bacterium]|nr:hypothetical protein [bacterium]